MLKLHRDPALRARMGEAARCRIREAFAIDSVAERLEAAYGRALAERRKTVAMVIPRYLPLAEGGAERQCRLQARELARRGHAVTVYTRRWAWSHPRVERMEGVRVVRMGWFYPVEEWVWTLRRRLTGRGKGEYLDGTTVDQIRMKQAGRPKRRIRVMAVLAAVGKAVHVLAWRLHFSRKSHVPDLWHVHADTWEVVEAAVSGAKAGLPVYVKPTGFPLRIAFEPVRFGGAGAAAQRAAFDRVRYLSLTPQIREGLVEMGVEESRIVDLPNGVEMPAGAASAAPARSHADRSAASGTPAAP
jgi:glycosyltransferase involved in cell wall biosynthesis